MRHPRRQLTTCNAFAASRQRPAFTTIELLVVIGIILLLMAISVLAFRHLDKLASTKQTHAQLGVCKNLLIEYERINGLQNIEARANVPPTPGVPVYVDPIPTPQNPNAKAYLLPAELSFGSAFDVSAHGNNSARYDSQAVKNTMAVMAILTRIPANRTALSNIPSNRLLEAPAGFPTPTIDQSVVLDGWGNPIIFVPAGGMIVLMADPSNPTGPPIPFVVRSSGTFPYSQLAQHPVSALDRPFFASAGQDGYFTRDTMNKTGTADDNVYSFQD